MPIVVGTEQQALLGELRGHSSPVWQVSWAHPKYGSVLASVGYDRQVVGIDGLVLVVEGL